MESNPKIVDQKENKGPCKLCKYRRHRKWRRRRKKVQKRKYFNEKIHNEKKHQFIQMDLVIHHGEK
jgi:hypothetical protein